MTTNRISLAALVVAVIALGIGIFGGGKTITNTETERIIREVVGGAGSIFSDPVEFNDRIIRHYGARATSTPGTLTGHTLVATDFTDPGALRVVNIAGAINTNYTFTLPSSTTLAALVPNVGDREEVCYFNVASSTSRHHLIFAEGTGIDFVLSTTTLATSATSSAGTAFSIEDGQVGCIDFLRKPADFRATDFTKPGDIMGILKFNATANDSQ